MGRLFECPLRKGYRAQVFAKAVAQSMLGLVDVRETTLGAANAVDDIRRRVLHFLLIHV